MEAQQKAKQKEEERLLKEQEEFRQKLFQEEEEAKLAEQKRLTAELKM